MADIDHYPLITEYKPPPWEFPTWSVLFTVVVIPLVLVSIAVLIYVEKGYPHGPEVFVGFYEVCDDRLGCGQVAGYEEDTTGLNNPQWVTFLRDSSVYIWLLVIFLFGVAIWQGFIGWEWWKGLQEIVKRRALPDDWSLVSYLRLQAERDG